MSLVDAVATRLGLQENSLAEMHADISVDMLTALNRPWKLIGGHPDFWVESPFPETFPVVSYEPLVILEDCDAAGDPNLCIQEWRVEFIVDKICDVESNCTPHVF